MAQEVRAYLDDDVYDDVCDEADRTGNSKSSVVADHVRQSIEDSPDSWFQRALGQSLFVSGAVVGVYDKLSIAIGLLLFGLGIMLYAEMTTHTSNGHTTWEAFKRTLGVN
jgi:hypothetical protein